MSKKESVLSQIEKDSFEIERFIFHIIKKDELMPTYLEELVLDEELTTFFKNRFSDISEGTQHVFIDKENSNLFNNVLSLVNNPTKNFIQVSKLLTGDFRKQHKKTMNSGAFITSLVRVNEDRKLVFLLKIDNRKVYSYTVGEDAKVILQEIKQNFVEDRKAIQKSALIDVSNHYSWDVLAFDRGADAKKALTDYFSNFLGVVEKDTPSSLTLKALGAIGQWAITHKSDLDPTQDTSSYKQRGIEYLGSTSKFKTTDFINAIIHDDDEDRKAKLKKAFKRHLDDIGLTGQSFPPNKGSLTPRMRRNKKETQEGVKIEWIGTAEDNNITIPTTKDKTDGLFHIVIKTAEIYHKE